MSKNQYLSIVVVPFLLACMASCEKDELPTDESFTDCKNCTFTYKEMNSGEIMFTYKNYWDGGDARDSGSSYNGLVIEVQSGLEAFSYGKKEIASDKVQFISMCIYCGTIPYQPADGKISGKKVENDKWLVDANVIMEGPEGSNRDTLVFKQYFSRETAP